MGSASRYWRLVKIEAGGGCKSEEVASVKAFFTAAFPEFKVHAQVPDERIQRQLMEWMKHPPNRDREQSLAAQRCLLCFISYQIERVCLQLEVNFGAHHGFTRRDLFPFVLDEDDRFWPKERWEKEASSYQSFARKILESFDPQQSNLGTWTTRRVKHHPELNTFLLQNGVYLVSDWAILNDTRPKQLQRIFSEFYQLTAVEVEQASRLLDSYHGIYRVQRLRQRQAGGRRKCEPPTTEQLVQIAKAFNPEGMLSSERVMLQLQKLASRLREYRIYVRGGSLRTESLDTSDDVSAIGQSSGSEALEASETEAEQNQFLSVYRQKFLEGLDLAIAHVTEAWLGQFQKKNSQKAAQFLKALQLFHCQGKTMAEIAATVGLSAQYQVTRLLKLKPFRADVRQQLLVILRDRVSKLAKDYTNLERLQNLDRQIEEAIDEQITKVITEAEAEASTAKDRPLTSLFSQRLCRYLDRRIN